MPIAIALIVLVVGSLLFHFLSPWTFTPLASHWDMIDFTMDITFIVTGIVFVLVNVFMAYAIIRYRYREGARAKYEPENKKLEAWLTIVTTIGVAAMLAPGLIVWAQFVNVPEDAVEIEVVGQQWRYSALTIHTASFRMTPMDAMMFWLRMPSCIFRSASRFDSGYARKTCCITSQSHNSESRWTWCLDR